MRSFWFVTAALAGLSAPALSQDSSLPTAIIVSAPGDMATKVDVGGDAIAGSGRPDLLEALARASSSLSLQDAQGNPYQPNLVYRGFTISPLQGQAQGLAVYLDGGRFNQPFGDTVQFDTLPEIAIDRIDVVGADPVYGLNALGGALVLSTKSGRSAPGQSASMGVGSYGELEMLGEAGWAGDRASVYVALQRSREDGWRRFSPSEVTTAFADIGFDDEQAGLHVKLTGSDSDLTGNGTAPVDLLEADYRAVFTHPDNTANRFGRVSLHPWVELGANTRFEATVYAQDFRQRTLNGDAADVEACDDETDLLCLETADGEQSVLTSVERATIEDVLGGEGYGVLNRSRTRTRAGGILAQMIDRRSFGPAENRLVIGFSHDRSHTQFGSATELGALTDERSVEGLGSIIAQPDGSIAPVLLEADTRYTGLFLSERLPVTRTLSLGFSLRWNDARLVLDDQLGTALDGSHHFDRINPGANLSWTPTPDVVLHAGYAESNRAPTPAELSCANEQAPCSLTNFFVADPPLKQVVARTFELGGQGRLESVDWVLTAYRATNENDIQFVASDTRGRAFFQNVGETQRQGFEAALAYHHGPLSARAGYTFTDATYRTALVLNSPDNPQADEEGQITVEPGDQLPGIPRHRAVVSVDFSQSGWTLGSDVQAVSGQRLVGDEANLEPRTESYLIANARGSVRIVGPLTLFGEIDNIFDARYATFGSFGDTEEVEMEEAPGATNPRSLGPGSPRRFTVGVSARF
jgi:outer membrane receptor protein involved in Fe transport